MKFPWKMNQQVEEERTRIKDDFKGLDLGNWNEDRAIKKKQAWGEKWVLRVGFHML